MGDCADIWIGVGVESYGVFYKMIGEDKRRHKCSTPNCRGVVYIEGNKMKCTDCMMCVKAKRNDDHLKSLYVLKTELNG